MKRDIHPAYRPVVFRDRAGGLTLLPRSTAPSDDPIALDGQTYPVIDVDISAASHPFWTGRGRVMDTEGRVERFNRRYGAGR